MRQYIKATRFYEINEKKLQSRVGNVLAMEIDIGNILNEKEEIDDNLNIMTFTELETLINSKEKPNHVDIVKATKNCLKKVLGLQVTNSTKVIVKNKDFFGKINGVLNNASKLDLVNYLLFAQVRKLAPYTTMNMKHIEAAFKVAIGEPSGLHSR